MRDIYISCACMYACIYRAGAADGIIKPPNPPVWTDIGVPGSRDRYSCSIRAVSLTSLVRMFPYITCARVMRMIVILTHVVRGKKLVILTKLTKNRKAPTAMK